ncbi:ABC transporter permease [Granulicoccus sp. GXG6511]|uniref:ABC transporter permease n=1 Tax=Granulicoccus sp. GXG6511 TaxID=3381351 RepID=UPI003D7C5883
MDWAWLQRNVDQILALTGQHALWSLIAVIAGLALALPVGYAVFRTGRSAGIWLAVVGLLYAIPSIALFVAMPLILGTGILDPLNVIGALAVYTFALLVRSVRDGFAGVDPTVRQAAVAMGYGPLRRVLGVEFPLALPVIFAGLRVATVSTISLVSVGAVIGNGALGQLFDRGFAGGFMTPIVAGIVIILVMALLADLSILGLQRVLLPWFGLGQRSGGRLLGRRLTGVRR